MIFESMARRWSVEQPVVTHNKNSIVLRPYTCMGFDNVCMAPNNIYTSRPIDLVISEADNASMERQWQVKHVSPNF